MQIAVNILCIVIAIIALFYNDIQMSFGFSETTTGINRITYMCAHTGILHLIINLIGFNVFYSVFKRLHITSYTILAFVCAFLATFGTEQTMPTVGLSGVVYAMLGIVFYRVHTNEMIFACFCTFCVNLVLHFFGNINAPLHFFAFSYAYIITVIINKVKRYETI